MLTLIVLSVALGLCLARFNVLAILMAAVVLIVGLFVYDMIRDAPLTHTLLGSLAIVFFLPVGYLAVQLLRPRRK